MSRHSLIPLVLVAAAALVACGDDAIEPAAPKPAATPSAVASAERYCALARDLDLAGEEHFSALARDAGPEDYEAAERSFIEEQAATLSELEAAAPPEITSDVRMLLAAQRGRAGLETARPVGQKAASEAEKRIKRFERQRC